MSNFESQFLAKQRSEELPMVPTQAVSPQEDEGTCEICEVSVMIATRNRPRELSESLAHLARQRNVDLEVIIVDDGSDVDLTPIVERHGGLNAKLIRQESQGAIVARNQGIQFCTNEIIVQLDDDSWLIEDDAAATLGDFMLKNPQIGALAVRLFFPWSESPTGVGRPFPRWNRSHLSQDYTFQGCGVVLRKSVAMRAGRYPEKFDYYNEEDYLAAQLIRLGYPILVFANRGVVHGYDAVTKPTWRPSLRPTIQSMSNLPAVCLDCLPIPLNLLSATVLFLRWALRSPRHAPQALIRLLQMGLKRQVPRMSWSRAFHYLRLRREVHREIHRVNRS